MDYSIGFLVLSSVLYSTAVAGFIILSNRYMYADDPDNLRMIKQRRNRFLKLTIGSGTVSLFIGIGLLLV